MAASDNRSYYMKLSSYVVALRPWSFSCSLAPVLLGCVLAFKSTGMFNLAILLISCVTALSVHAAGNLVNTYFDYVKGIDSKKSDDRTLVDSIITKDEVVGLASILYCVGCAGFVALVILSPAKMEHLALVYFGGLSSSFLYTGGAALKYIALGDLIIMTIFGPVTVIFAYMAQTGTVSTAAAFYALPAALSVEAVLHSNNTRDMEADRVAGIVTLAIILGPALSKLLYGVLLFTPYVMVAVCAIKHSVWFALPLFTMPAAFRNERELRAGMYASMPRKTAKLNLFFNLLFVASVLCCSVEKLPFIGS
ncbi:unnamed protein product [Notodromas monacha]|uniref:UbiA prenyltransferase domain-containing protein 1 n=1 Tax=Notodromas monacha TaxID=399045 RepID=A0A7R9GIL9_9CRUS|nr:unnamed protein product [Notodromas monacha]CAG0922731.1 unnamed protein product [Notodromas monacha]